MSYALIPLAFTPFLWVWAEVWGDDGYFERKRAAARLANIQAGAEDHTTSDSIEREESLTPATAVPNPKEEILTPLRQYCPPKRNECARREKCSEQCTCPRRAESLQNEGCARQPEGAGQVTCRCRRQHVECTRQVEGPSKVESPTQAVCPRQTRCPGQRECPRPIECPKRVGPSAAELQLYLPSFCGSNSPAVTSGLQPTYHPRSVVTTYGETLFPTTPSNVPQEVTGGRLQTGSETPPPMPVKYTFILEPPSKQIGYQVHRLH